jgi:DNA-binding PadR family transcriptional regulator
LDNPLVLAVLGLLLEAPKHPYQMHAELLARGKDQAAVVNRGSLYDVVEKLAETGWIAPQERERSGNRPERTTYVLTPAGHEELVTRLDHQIRTPKRDLPQFLGAISYLGALGPTGAADALTERAGHLRERITTDEHRLGEAHGSGVPRLFVIEAEYALSQVRAELDWVTAITDEIRQGTLSWPTSGGEQR